MKVIAINGSPRKGWNTMQMLEAAIDGAKSAGAEVELYHLYDYTYTGCKACFACKRKSDAYPLRTCAVKDELAPILAACADADAILIGSPIFFGNCPGHVLEFYERLIYPWSPYDAGPRSSCPHRIDYGVIFTLNQPDEHYKDGSAPTAKQCMRLLGRMQGKGYCCAALNTTQFDDYEKFHASRINVEAKKQQREAQFPKDLEEAREMGRQLVLGLSTPVEG